MVVIIELSREDARVILTSTLTFPTTIEDVQHNTHFTFCPRQLHVHVQNGCAFSIYEWIFIANVDGGGGQIFKVDH